LRATLSFFEPLARDARLNRIKTDLRWLSGMLGAVRDLDVFYAKFLLARLDERPLDGGEDLCSYFASQRASAFSELSGAFGSNRFRETMLHLMEWLECGDWLALSAIEGSPGSEAFGGFVRKRLRKRLQRLSKRACAAPTLDRDAAHLLRKKAKDLRY